jgi:signal transduction histidine kinase/ActR/RegA family two-component response regulator
MPDTFFTPLPLSSDPVIGDYHLWMMLLSFGVAVLACYLALDKTPRLQQNLSPVRRQLIQCGIALTLTTVISGIYYAAMHSAIFLPLSNLPSGVVEENPNDLLAITLGLIALLVLLLALIALGFSQKITARLKDEVALRTQELQSANEALIRAKHSAEEANMAKTEFLASISHELRTPLTSIIGLVDLLETKHYPADKEDEYLDMLRKGADAVLGLVDELLDVARIETRTVTLEHRLFDLHELASEVFAIMKLRADSKGLGLEISYHAMLPTKFMGDPLRIRQVLVNLLSNALKFTEKGRVSLMLHGQPSPLPDRLNVTLRVRDTGIGIAPEKLESIFEPFTQNNHDHPLGIGGAGLGLTIVRGLVQRMGGYVTVTSVLGEGTEFIITLPLEIAPAKAILQPAPSVRARPKRSASRQIATVTTAVEEDITDFSRKKSRTNGKHPIMLSDNKAGEPNPPILIVEDNLANLLVLTTYLTSLGYRYEVAKNGQEAINKYLTGNFRLVLMDLQMPVVDGLEATRVIRELESHHGYARSGIIALTAQARPEDKQRCLAAGMDDYIAKPYEPGELAQKIQTQLASEMQQVEVSL